MFITENGEGTVERQNIASHFWLEYKNVTRQNGNGDFIWIIKTWQVNAYKFFLHLLALK